MHILFPIRQILSLHLLSFFLSNIHSNWLRGILFDDRSSWMFEIWFLQLLVLHNSSWTAKQQVLAENAYYIPSVHKKLDLTTERSRWKKFISVWVSHFEPLHQPCKLLKERRIRDQTGRKRWHLYSRTQWENGRDGFSSQFLTTALIILIWQCQCSSVN